MLIVVAYQVVIEQFHVMSVFVKFKPTKKFGVDIIFNGVTWFQIIIVKF